MLTQIGLYPINTPASEAPISLSLDGSILYFASHRLGGYGGSSLESKRVHFLRDLCTGESA